MQPISTTLIVNAAFRAREREVFVMKRIAPDMTPVS